MITEEQAQRIKDASSAVIRIDSLKRATVILLDKDENEMSQVPIKDHEGIEMKTGIFRNMFTKINRMLRWVPWEDHARKNLPCDVVDEPQREYEAMRAKLAKYFARKTGAMGRIVESHCGCRQNLTPEQQADAAMHGILHSERIACLIKDGI